MTGVDAILLVVVAVVTGVIAFAVGLKIGMYLGRTYIIGQRMTVPSGHSYEKGDKIKLKGKRWVVIDAYSTELYVRRRFP